MQHYIFSDRAVLERIFGGKRVAIVASGPGCLENEVGFIDSHDIVVRVNNHKLTPATGFRTDVHYSFYGESIRKSAEELQREGVKLCLCKCPDSKFMDSPWHRQRRKENGVDFRYIYERRKGWWFCPTYVPQLPEFMESFNLLGRHIPSTGFSAILLIQSLAPASIYLTGFDFFASKIHNTNERWRPGNPHDPIRHVPEKELQWLRKNASSFTMDKRLESMMGNL